MKLDNIDLLSLQPSYMQQDNFVQALCKALNPHFQELSDEAKLVYIYGRIDELEEDVIDSLAWQFHVDFYDSSLSLDVKRELVKKSRMLHKKKGTPYAVESACSTVFGRTKLKEWFEYNGKPFYFSLDIDITNVGASPEQLKKLDALIYAYKNARSWLDIINLYYTSVSKVYIASTIAEGEIITVYPWINKEIKSKAKVIIPASEGIGYEKVTVYPK